jgi:hypothetical protein
MPFITTHPRVLALGVACAAAGAGAGTVAAAGASAGHRSASGTRTDRAAPARQRGLIRLARRTVHGELTVRTPGGFRTVTIDRGVVDSVSGDTLTMTDGTSKASDQKVTLTIPSSARVRNDRRTASLPSLTAGERVLVVQLPKRTVVRARPAHTTTSSS